MKWLTRHLLKYLCLLPVLYLVVLYSHCEASIRPDEYMHAMHTKMLTVLLSPHFLIPAGLLLAMAFIRGMTMVWNAIYCCATILLILQIVLMLGIGGAILPSALWSIPGSEILPQIPEKFPAAMNIIPVIWLLGAICSKPFRNITAACCINFIIWLLLAYACHALAQLWENMQEPYKPELLVQFKSMRWCTAILPGLFMFLYTFFLALFEALIPRRLREKKTQKESTKEKTTTAAT